MGDPAENLLPDLEPVNDTGFGDFEAANNNDHFDLDDSSVEDNVIPFPGMAESQEDLPPANEGPAFGSEELDEATAEAFDQIETELPEMPAGADSVFDQEKIKAILKKEAIKLAGNSKDSIKNREALTGWINNYMYQKYKKLRMKAVAEKGDVGLLTKFWNRLSAEEQREFATKHDQGILDFGKKILKSVNIMPGMKESKAVYKYAKRNTVGRVPILNRLLTGLKDWSPEQITELLAYGVLDYKGEASDIQVIQGNLGSISKLRTWVVSIAGTYFGGMLGGSAGKAAGGALETGVAKIEAVRQTIQREVPTPEEKPSLIQRTVGGAVNKVLGRNS